MQLDMWLRTGCALNLWSKLYLGGFHYPAKLCNAVAIRETVYS